MKLVFIRHAEPDYINDSLTEKGKREAQCLAQYLKDWKIDEIFVSPLGRARRTAEPALCCTIETNNVGKQLYSSKNLKNIVEK